MHTGPTSVSVKLQELFNKLEEAHRMLSQQRYNTVFACASLLTVFAALTDMVLAVPYSIFH